MRRIIIGVMFLALCGSAFGQISAGEAAAKLKERQAAKQAEREKLVTVKQGALDDLNAEVARLKGELAYAKQQISALHSLAGGQTASAAPKRKGPPASVEIGMTRDEVLAFVKSHKKFQVISVQAARPTSGTQRQTVVQRSGTMEGNRNGLNQESVAEKSVASKTETIELGAFEEIEVSDGQVRSGGFVQNLSHFVTRQTGRLHVLLVDDVVTEVTAG